MSIHPTARLAMFRVGQSVLMQQYLMQRAHVNGRLGVRLEKTVKQNNGELKPWVYVGVNHEFTDAPTMHYGNSHEFPAQDYDTAGELRFGVTADITSGFSAYGDVCYIYYSGDYENISGNAGLKINW